MASDACTTCANPLVLTLVDSDDDESAPSSSAPLQVPDEVLLRCGCKFHWQCLLDAYEVQVCPACGEEISSPAPGDASRVEILCRLRNEGGVQERLDILPILMEESYLKAYPEERKCRAFLEFCREGDVNAVISVVQDDSDDEDEGEGMDVEGRAFKGQIDLVRYQDPMGEGWSGLHAAVSGGSQEVAWLLLLLASELPLEQIPGEVLQEGDALGIRRPDSTGKTDIRTLTDAQGRTAEDLAKAMGGVWASWVDSGRLRA